MFFLSLMQVRIIAAYWSPLLVVIAAYGYPWNSSIYVVCSYVVCKIYPSTFSLPLAVAVVVVVVVIVDVYYGLPWPLCFIRQGSSTYLVSINKES